jgi:hypothetical protein
MNYKTIILEMLQAQTDTHERLRQRRELLSTTNRLAVELRESHGAYLESLKKQNPKTDIRVLSSMAMESAVAEMAARFETVLPSE